MKIDSERSKYCSLKDPEVKMKLQVAPRFGMFRDEQINCSCRSIFELLSRCRRGVDVKIEGVASLKSTRRVPGYAVGTSA